MALYQTVLFYSVDSVYENAPSCPSFALACGDCFGNLCGGITPADCASELEGSLEAMLISISTVLL